MKEQFENIAHNASQFATLSGLLAAIMFALAFQMLTLKKNNEVKGFLIGTTLMSSISFLTSAVLSTFMSMASANLSLEETIGIPLILAILATAALILFGLGFFSFAIAVATSGAIYSENMAKFTSVAAVFSMIIVMVSFFLLLVYT